jgi:hypothetical protein
MGGGATPAPAAPQGQPQAPMPGVPAAAMA